MTGRRHRDDLVVGRYFESAIAVLHGGDIDGEARTDAGLCAAGGGCYAVLDPIAGTSAGDPKGEPRTSRAHGQHSIGGIIRAANDSPGVIRYVAEPASAERR